MVDWFASQPAVQQALLATLFTWGVTALGASLVFFARRVDDRLMASMAGFAAGVMIAASFWSLLAPAIEMAESSGQRAWLVAAVGFLLGGAFLYAADQLLDLLAYDTLDQRRQILVQPATKLGLQCIANHGLQGALTT